MEFVKICKWKGILPHPHLPPLLPSIYLCSSPEGWYLSLFLCFWGVVTLVEQGGKQRTNKIIKIMYPRRKRADLFLVCYRSVETSAADLQIVYRSSTDYLRIVCRMFAEYLQNVCRMSAEMICNLCRRSADEGGMNSKHNNRRTAPIKHLLFLS